MKQRILNTLEHYNHVKNHVLNAFNHPVIVLMYHRILDQNEQGSPYTVTTSHFRDQMLYLKDHFEMVGLEDNWQNLERPACVITFDDGYYDNYTIARDFLSPQSIPATFFVATQNIGTKNLFWWDELNLHQAFYEKSSGLTMMQLFRQLKNSQRNDQIRFFNKHQPPIYCDEATRKAYRSLTKQELISLSDLPYMSIGAHTINHLNLSKQSTDEIAFELCESQLRLEHIINKPVTSCSFPYGSYNRKVIDVSQKLGFNTACIGVSQNAYHWTNRLKIPRISAEDVALSTFKRQINRLIP